MAQLRHRQDDFHQAGARLAAVCMGSVAESARFVARHRLSFALIADPEAELYQRFGLQQHPLKSFFSPRLLRQALTLLAQGYRPSRPVGEIRRQSAIFVIDTSGTVVFSQVPAGPAEEFDLDTVGQRVRQTGAHLRT